MWSIKSSLSYYLYTYLLYCVLIQKEHPYILCFAPIKSNCWFQMNSYTTYELIYIASDTRFISISFTFECWEGMYLWWGIYISRPQVDPRIGQPTKEYMYQGRIFRYFLKKVPTMYVGRTDHLYENIFEFPKPSELYHSPPPCSLTALFELI